MTHRYLAVALAAVLVFVTVDRAMAADVPTAVVFVGGYGADSTEAGAQFEALRIALLERSPDAVVVPYSYTGTSFDGCVATPSPYTRSDTAQAIETSKRVLRETLTALRDACNVERVALVGHSLGGLVAFEALSETPSTAVSDLITVDSPLGGVPERLVRTCIDVGFCAEGAIAEYLAELYPRSLAIEADNAARAAALAESGTRVSAWGNENDCFYNVALCASLARALLGPLDARETQWLGMPNTVRRSYPMARTLASIGPSHTAVLIRSAAELAADLTP